MAIFTDHSSIDGGGEAEEVVPLTEMEARPIRVVFAAIPTLLAIADAAHGGGGGVPTRWVRRARSALAERDSEALLPLLARPDGFVPDCLLPLPDGTSANADPTSSIKRIAEAAGDELLRELTASDAPGVVGPWIEVAQDPNRWAVRYARALYRIWKATQAELRGASALIEREIDRVGAAAARGAIGPLLASLYPGGSLDNGSWILPAHRPRKLRLAERGLVLLPKLTGQSSPLIRAYDGDALTHLAYPVPGADRTFGDPPARSSLEALMGTQRLTVLSWLDRPRTIGSVADVLIAVPATATHHVDTLEAAGLVVRERRGREVLVHRTARGSALLALYETQGEGRELQRASS